MHISNEALFVLGLPDDLKTKITSSNGTVEVPISSKNHIGHELIYALGKRLGAQISTIQPDKEGLDLRYRLHFESLKLSDIKIFLIDLDDTIFMTHKLFKKKIKEAVDILITDCPQIDRESFQSSFEKISKEAYKIPTLGVRPSPRWEYVLDNLETEFNIPIDTKSAMLTKIMEVYSEAPEFHDGSIEFLQKLQSLGKEIKFVTHAGEEWTQIKINALEKATGIIFNYLCTPVERDKDSKDWKDAAGNYTGKEVLVIGDNVIADNKNALIAEFATVNISYINPWDGFHAELPLGVLSIKNLMEIFTLLPNT